MITAVHERLARSEPVAILGEAGIGKTAVVNEYLSRSGRRTFLGAALPALSWVDYLPLARALGQRPPVGDVVAVARRVRAEVRNGILVLEDLHWADRSTLATLPLLAELIDLIVTVREEDPGPELVRAVLGEAGFETMRLEGLGEQESLEVVRQLRADLSPSQATAIVVEAGGNPLLLRELALVGRPSVSLASALRTRLGRHSAEAREAFAMLSLLGRSGERQIVGDAIEELVSDRLVSHDEAGYTVRHAFLAEVIANGLDDKERRRLHGTLATRLKDPGEAARHYAAAGHDAIAHSLALKAAERSHSRGEQARHLAVAASCLVGPAGEVLRLEAAEALIDEGDVVAAEELLSQVQSADTNVQARVALERSRGSWRRSDAEEHVKWAHHGLHLIAGTNSIIEVALLIELALGQAFVWHAKDALERAQAAWSLACHLGFQVARARLALGTAVAIGGAYDKAVEHLFGAVNIAREEGDLEIELEATVHLAAVLQMALRADEAERLAREAADKAGRHGLGKRQVELASLAAHIRFNQEGSTDRVIREHEQLLDDLSGPITAAVVADLAVALADRGEGESARRLVERYQRSPILQSDLLIWAKAEVEWLFGRPEQAIAVVDQHADVGLGSASEYDRKITRQYALLDLGRSPEPSVDPERVTRYHRACADESKGLSALGSGRARQAEAHFRRAAKGWSVLYKRAEIKCSWGACEAARLAGDVERARGGLLRVERLAQEAGMEVFLARVRESLRRCGVSRAEPRGKQLRGGLTGRELELLELTGQGLTTATIARRLHLAPSTIDSVIESAMLKLNARTRAQAVAIHSDGHVASRPLIVTASIAETAVFQPLMEAGGWFLCDQDDMPTDPWDLSGSAIVCRSSVDSRAQLALAVLSAVRGAGIVATAPNAALRNELITQLGRLGAVETGEDSVAPSWLKLDETQRRLLELLGKGWTIGQAAETVYLSRRTAHRRLASARHLLGVSTTTEAIVMAGRELNRWKAPNTSERPTNEEGMGGSVAPAGDVDLGREDLSLLRPVEADVRFPLTLPPERRRRG
jgi:DNA-binding NarL/FixJ family response regulator